MDLRKQDRLAFPEVCFICRWVGHYFVFWPQQFEVSRLGVRGYLNVHEPFQGGPRSKHREILVCPEHYRALEQNWIQVAQDEVDLERAWYQYIERTER